VGLIPEEDEILIISHCREPRDGIRNGYVHAMECLEFWTKLPRNELHSGKDHNTLLSHLGLDKANTRRSFCEQWNEWV